MINILQQIVEKFIRTYFFNKRDEDYAYLLDQAVGLEGYIAFPILLQCNWWNTQVSHLTVPAPSVKRKAKVLYINADEDHVSLQDGKKAMVPLISIHEGIERRGKRGQCINPHYISSHGKPIEELKYVLDRYHPNKVILEVTSKQPEKRPSLHAALYSGDWQASARLIQQLKQDAKDDSDKKRIQEFSRYVKKIA